MQPLEWTNRSCNAFRQEKKTFVLTRGHKLRKAAQTEDNRISHTVQLNPLQDRNVGSTSRPENQFVQTAAWPVFGLRPNLYSPFDADYGAEPWEHCNRFGEIPRGSDWNCTGRSTLRLPRNKLHACQWRHQAQVLSLNELSWLCIPSCVTRVRCARANQGCKLNTCTELQEDAFRRRTCLC